MGFGFGSLPPGQSKSTFSFGNSPSDGPNTFGTPAQSQHETDDSMGIDNNTTSPFGPRIPRKERKPETPLSMDAPLSSSRSGEGGDEHLAALRAKIQEKKNRLLKMKKVNPSNENDVKDTSQPASLSNSELAAKNALRFAGINQGQTTSKLLPTDLQGRDSQEGTSSSSDVYEGGDTIPEDEDDLDGLQLRTLSGAKDLIGVCRSMCPDEELLRREREGDIQLLEVMRVTIAFIFWTGDCFDTMFFCFPHLLM
jgi:hypothetical protein